MALLHVITSRSAAVRLAPVVEALGRTGLTQGLLDASGVSWVGEEVARAPRTAAEPAGSAAATLAEALERTRPSLLLLAGDGEATLAAALIAARLEVPIARLGAGLRSGDRTVDGELNRLVLDELSDLLLTDGREASDQLRAEGMPSASVRCVGSTLPDALARWSGEARRRRMWERLGVPAGGYVVCVLHKAENLADLARLTGLVEALAALARKSPLVFCLHPPTSAALDHAGLVERLRAAGITLTRTLDYVDFVSLESAAAAVITDSGGVQEETTILGVPCLTLGHASERRLTLTHGTNVLVGDDASALVELCPPPGAASAPEPTEIPLWDGGAACRVAVELLSRTRP